MTYYILGVYVIITLWYSTHCKDCYFSKPPFVIHSPTNTTTCEI